HEHAESGHACDGKEAPHTWSGRMGARVLPQVPEQAARLRQGVVERGELARGGTEIRGVAENLVIPAKAFPDSSFPRKRESMLSISGCDDSRRVLGSRWIPAFAGMTSL